MIFNLYESTFSVREIYNQFLWFVKKLELLVKEQNKNQYVIEMKRTCVCYHSVFSFDTIVYTAFFLFT